ncbi:MAG: ABC transporter permease subunit [Chloroflexota bacterium]|nr:ABC transporter permease subunit [Chloroflexota bacterium]
MLRLLLQELRSRRNGIIGWAIGLSLLPAIYVAIYPQFADDLAGMQEILDLEIYKAMGMNFGTFEDWLASTIINLVPIILAIYAVLDGTGTLAGEEDSGKLEIIVVLPIPRWQIVTVKAIAHGIALFLILLIVDIVTTIVFLGIENDIETSLAAWDVFWSLLYLWPIVMAFGMISLFLGTFTPSRRIAALIATVVVIVSYFGNNLSSQVSTLESLKPFFLYNYLDATATLWVDGPQVNNVLVLLGVALVSFLLAVVFFQQRDITVGVWPWQRGKIPADAIRTA